MKVIIGSDHRGIAHKKEIKSFLENEGHQVIDVGAYNNISVDYPDIAKNLISEVIKENAFGVILCGTGIGVSISCNRNRKIRCALCCSKEMAKLAREHNDANVIAIGCNNTTCNQANQYIKTFLNTEFEGGRHRNRVEKLS